MRGLISRFSHGHCGTAELRDAEAQQTTLGALPCPVLVYVDIGHRPPQMLLVNGALATLQWSLTGEGLLTQTLA